MKWSEFVVSEWFWAAGAVAVAVAALIGSLATFVGSAISRYRNRPEPEWDITFDPPYATTDVDGFVGNKVAGRITNIGDGAAFQVRVTMPDGEPAKLRTDTKKIVEVVPVLRTGEGVIVVITSALDVWDEADSLISWVDPPTRRHKGGREAIRPYKQHAKPVPEYRNQLFDTITKEEWLVLRSRRAAGEGSMST